MIEGYICPLFIHWCVLVMCGDMSLVKLLQIAKEVDTSLELTVFSTAELFNDDCTVKVISIFFNLDKDNLYDLSAVSAILNVHKMKIICAKTIHFVRSLATGRSGPRGSGWIKAPDFVTFRYYKGGRSSAKRTGRLYPRGNPWYSLSEAELTSGHMVLFGGTTEKILSDTTGNRSRDRPTSSAVP